MRTRKRREYGQYIVADPEICHGQLTFKGTRILVKDVLHMVVKGWDWDRISAAYDGRISHDAIAEAIEFHSERAGKPQPRLAEQMWGTIQNVDRETLIQLTEDEKYSGY